MTGVFDVARSSLTSTSSDHLERSSALVYTYSLVISTMLPLLPLVLPLFLLPFTVQAGFYGAPVLNLDAKDFKKAMATEHAAVSASAH
jgi:hypothetical protein